MAWWIHGLLRLMFVLVVVIEEVGVTAVVEGLRSKRCHNGRRHQRNETRINTYPACTRHGLIAVSSGSCGLSSVVVFNVAERKCSRKPTHTRGTLRTRQLEDGKPCEQSEKIVGISHDLSFVQVMVCNGDLDNGQRGERDDSLFPSSEYHNVIERKIRIS